MKDSTYGKGRVNVLSINNALGLDDEEVEELLEFINASLDRLSGNGPVLLGAHLGGKTVVEQDLANDFKTSSDCGIVSWVDKAGNIDVLTAEDEVREAKEVVQDVEVACHEDEHNDRAEDDTSRARVLPLQGFRLA
jgi:hypothetical protein